MEILNNSEFVLVPCVTNTTLTPLSPVPIYVAVATILSCTTSILGAMGIFSIHFFYPETRTTSRNFLIHLTIADLLTAIGNLLGTIRYMVISTNPKFSYCHNDGYCTTQSFLTTFSCLCSFFWTVAIAAYFFATIVKLVDWSDLGRIKACLYTICWGIPGVICLIALSMSALGPTAGSDTSGGWCWINTCGKNNDTTNILWMVFTGKGWEIISYILPLVLYMVLRYHVKVMIKKSQMRPFGQGRPDHEMALTEQFVKNDDKFLYVPFVLYILRVWGTIRFFISMLQPDCPNDTLQFVDDVLIVLQGIGDSGQAFWNFLLFVVFTKPIRGKFIGLLCKCCRTGENYSEL